MRSNFSKTLKASALVCAAALLAACSNAPVRQAQWVAPELGAQSRLLQSGPVLVVCDFYDAAVRQICQDDLVRAVRAKGGNPVTLPAGTALLGDRELDAQLVAPAKTIGAGAVVVLALNPVTSQANSGLSVGLGGFSFGGGGGVGVGFSAPIGGDRLLTTWAGNGRVTDARTGRLVWTTSLSAAPGALEGQLQSLADGVATAAQESGLF